MENEKKNNRTLIGILIGLIIALLIGVCLFATGTINFKQTTTPNKEQTNNNNEPEANESNNSLNQEVFKKIIDDELYILFGFKSLNDLTNIRKLTLVFNKLDNNYNTIDTATKEKVEETFNSTSIRNLAIQHESFDVFTYENNTYTKNKNTMSKRNMFNCGYANKVDSFEKQGNKYVIAVKYLFTDACPVSEYYYGSYSPEDQNESNKIVEQYENSKVNDNNKYIEPQEYLDNNYEKIKDKLDTYVYTFEVDNDGKINLVDFSIK